MADFPFFQLISHSLVPLIRWWLGDFTVSQFPESIYLLPRIVIYYRRWLIDNLAKAMALTKQEYFNSISQIALFLALAS